MHDSLDARRVTRQRILHHSSSASQNRSWTNTDLLVAAQIIEYRLGPRFTRGRFRDYQQIIHDCSRQPPRDIRSRRLLHEAYTSTLQAYLACLFLDSSPPSADQVRRLAAGRAGGAYGRNTAPWDTQFEMYCLALLRMAGLVDARFSEPDLIVPAGPKTIGFAVKRVTSERRQKLATRLRDAIRQLRAQQLPGVIMIEVAAPSLDRLASRTKTWATATTRRLAADVARWDTDRRVMALLLTRFRLAVDSPHRIGVTLNTYVFNAMGVAQSRSIADWLAARGRRLLQSLAEVNPRALVSAAPLSGA
jgi:hypothetical protein